MSDRIFKIGLVSVIVFLLFFAKCQSDSLARLKGEETVLREQIKTAEDGLAVFEENRLREKDSLTTENDKKEKEIERLKKEAEDSQLAVAKIKNQLKKDKKRIKNMSYKEVAKDLNKIYKTDSVIATETSVNMSDSIPQKVLSDVVEKDALQKEVAEKDKQLESKDNTIVELEDINFNQTTMLISAEEQIKKEKENSELKDKLNENLTKQVKKPRVGQILIGVAAGVIGTLLITN